MDQVKDESIEERAKALFKAISHYDDKLGAYADYEGDENGPTYYLWNRGPETFELHCLRAIEHHRSAIRLWLKLRKLNLKRKT